MQINDVLMKRVSDRLQRYGFERCTPENVREVYDTGTLANDDAALVSAIIAELEEMGLQ